MIGFNKRGRRVVNAETEERLNELNEVEQEEKENKLQQCITNIK